MTAREIQEAVEEANELLKKRLGDKAGHLVIAISPEGPTSMRTTFPRRVVPDVAQVAVNIARRAAWAADEVADGAPIN